MARKVSWGVLGAADIGLKRVIPGMQKGEVSRIDAIASRDLAKAKAAAAAHGIAKAYGSYDELLADPAIEAIYNPLPNQLHVPWTIRALEAGKHVLCEKPIALDAKEAEALVAARDRTGKLVAFGALFAAWQSSVTKSGVTSTGLKTTFTGIAGATFSTLAISCECSATFFRVSGP